MMIIFFYLIALALIGVGIPFLIIGIIGVAKTNRKIARLKAQENQNAQQQNYYYQPEEPVYQYNEPTYEQYSYEQPTYEQPAYEQPAYEQPAYEQPAYEQPTYEQPAYEQSEANYYQEAPNFEQANAQQNAGTNPNFTNFIDIDWRKYAPLEAGITYSKSRDYHFHRAEGFVGSVPQSFVNRTFPKCPICCHPDPYWTIGQHNQMSWKGNLYMFKCSRCEGVISMSMPDVTTLGNGGSGIAFNPTVGLTNLAVKGSSGKDATAVYAVIESVGTSGVTFECEGKEFKLEHLQEMFLRQ